MRYQVFARGMPLGALPENRWQWYENLVLLGLREPNSQTDAPSPYRADFAGEALVVEPELQGLQDANGRFEPWSPLSGFYNAHGVRFWPEGREVTRADWKRLNGNWGSDA